MRILLMLFVALTLVACGSDETEEPESEPTVGKEIADDYNRAMDKAREVENQVMEQKRKIDDVLREAEAKAEEDT